MTRKVSVVLGGILLGLATLLLIRTLAASSQDFIVWTQQDSGTVVDLFAVTWGGGQYVAVGENGKIATSPDGITWTNRFSGTSDSLDGVAWNGSLFVAAGGNTIISSTDGVAWTLRSEVPIGGSLYGVAWGNGIFVAVGKRPSVSSGLTMISSDGISWTTYNNPGLVPLDIDWVGGNFYLMFNDHITRGADGLGWATVLTRSGSDFRGVCQGGSSYLAVGEDVTCLSADGSDWTCTANSVSTQRDVIFSGELFVTGGNDVYLSSDGVSWTHSLGGTFYGLAVSGSGVVAVGLSGQIFLGDTDTIIFYDGFESGDTTAWSFVIPPPTPTPTPTNTPTNTPPVPPPTNTPPVPPPTNTPPVPPPTNTPPVPPPTNTPPP